MRQLCYCLMSRFVSFLFRFSLYGLDSTSSSSPGITSSLTHKRNTFISNISSGYANQGFKFLKIFYICIDTQNCYRLEVSLILQKLSVGKCRSRENVFFESALFLLFQPLVIFCGGVHNVRLLRIVMKKRVVAVSHVEYSSSVIFHVFSNLNIYKECNVKWRIHLFTLCSFLVEWVADSTWFSRHVEFQLYVDPPSSVPESLVACQRYPSK